MYIHFHEEIKVLDFSEEKIALQLSETLIEWTRPNTRCKETVQRFLSKGLTEAELIDLWQEIPECFYFLERLKNQALLSYTLYNETIPLCTLRPHPNCSDFRLKNRSQLLQAIEDLSTFQISSFVWIRNRKGALLAETTLAAVSLELKHPDATALWLKLAQPTTMQGLEDAFPKISSLILKDFLALLYGASFLETNDPVLNTWDFHDLLFHTRSRRGRSEAVAITQHRFAPLPPFKSMREDTEWIPLFKPDLEAIKQNDLSFAKVVESRRSIREQGERPISLNQLGEFLYRSARVQKARSSPYYETSWRPYPSGGACYELEIYLLIYNCEGLERGLYYYHPQEHALTRIAEWSPSLKELLTAASVSTRKQDLSQILLLIACRFQRINWKYQSMAYSTLLKDTGALMQTMYLVANALGLAPCAVGAGNSETFAKLAKVNYYEETTVGEFILGSRKI